jgi:hypothetical protein
MILYFSRRGPQFICGTRMPPLSGLVGQGSETFYCGSEAVQNFLFVAQELRSTEHSPIVTVMTVVKANP